MNKTSKFIRVLALASSLTLLIAYVFSSQFKRRTVIHSHSKYYPANHSQSKYRTVTPAYEERLMLPGSKAPIDALIPAQELKAMPMILVFPTMPDISSGSAGSATTPPPKP